MLKKIMSVVGARPQFIKLAPLSKLIREKYLEIIVHTGQHYDVGMSEQFFKDLEIKPPNFNLNIGSGSHGTQTGNMLIKLEKVYDNEKPDIVIVYGDTNSTLAGALAAVKMHIPIIHVESGLRSLNRIMPEEINRVMADHASDFLFAPTKAAIDNLKKEGLEDKSFLTGDIMVDALKNNLDIALEKSTILRDMRLESKEFILLTLHRPYNVDNPNILKKILNLLAKINSQIIFAVHPRTKKILEDNSFSIGKNISVIRPVGYLDFINMEYHSKKIVTDSGGIQKEAYILKKPCITLRPETEWVETVNEGWNILLTPESGNFIETIESFTPHSKQKDVFGSNVSEKMFQIIQKI